MASEYEDRKRLTFEQAEGAEPLPSQLQSGELSPQLRALLWDLFFEVTGLGDDGSLSPVWKRLLYKYHVEREHKPADEFTDSLFVHSQKLKTLFFEENYINVFGFVQWILRQGLTGNLHIHVEEVLHQCRASYAVFDCDTIVPIGSDAEKETLERAFADVAASEFRGARSHLRQAGSKLTDGDYAGSIRESIHAVEAVARVLEPATNTLAPALSKLEKSIRIHPALRNGFSSLYGFTSDEKGIRHALLDQPGAQVDATDALYMLGSCAAFVSYLINKARQAGLLGDTG